MCGLLGLAWPSPDGQGAGFRAYANEAAMLALLPIKPFAEETGSLSSHLAAMGGYTGLYEALTTDKTTTVQEFIQRFFTSWLFSSLFLPLFWLSLEDAPSSSALLPIPKKLFSPSPPPTRET